jgi:hypothetical protein
MPIDMVLEIMNLEPWVQISVRRHTDNGVEYLGGGHRAKIVARFKDLRVQDTTVIDNILVFHVEDVKQ